MSAWVKDALAVLVKDGSACIIKREEEARGHEVDLVVVLRPMTDGERLTLMECARARGSIRCEYDVIKHGGL